MIWRFYPKPWIFRPYPGLRLESLAAAAAAIAAEPQPQAFDPDWHPYGKIREYKRKTSLFSTTSFLLILLSLVRYSASLEVIQNHYMSHQKVSQAQNGHSMVSRKKFIISESRLIERINIIYNVLEQMESVYASNIQLLKFSTSTEIFENHLRLDL